VHRRKFLAASASAAAAAMAIRLTPTRANADLPPGELVAILRRSPARVVLSDGTDAPRDSIRLDFNWRTGILQSKVTNTSKNPLSIREVVVFDATHALDADTPVYAEGFTMLTQTAGTLGEPIDLAYPDRKHYRIPEPEDLRTVYGMMMIGSGINRTLLGFTSCKRFVGRFSFSATRLRTSIDTENLTLKPGESWALEDLFIDTARPREQMLSTLATRIESNHPRLRHDPPPAGWCSWYWFGARVKSSDITSNLDWIAENAPRLKYIQIDDGYQPIMGDWLETGKAFGGDVKGVLEQIKQKGFEPAIWVAPFIASENSHLFQRHPDWFVKDDAGKPLRSDRIGFGGWRQGPWYCLDGTHPEAQKHLENVFATMRNEWGCTYFKLDANYWGALHGGVHHDPRATRVEAYRRGMAAVLKGAADSFILGCNHPLWPSLGVIHGSRSSGDIQRSWETVSSTARQNLLRNWQNGRLWWNDPDCVVLVDKPGSAARRNRADLTDNEFQFHATAIYAAGGLVLDGDDLPRITPARKAMLDKLIPPVGVAAQFPDESLDLGITHLPDRKMYALFNWSEAPVDRWISFDARSTLKDYWTGKDLGTHDASYKVTQLPAHSATLIEARNA
jgi:alpha-galactosidase